MQYVMSLGPIKCVPFQKKLNNEIVLCYREAVAHMKEGEEEKTKCYSALIWTEKNIKKEDLDLLDNVKVCAFFVSFSLKRISHVQIVYFLFFWTFNCF